MSADHVKIHVRNDDGVVHNTTIETELPDGTRVPLRGVARVHWVVDGANADALASVTMEVYASTRLALHNPQMIARITDLDESSDLS